MSEATRRAELEKMGIRDLLVEMGRYQLVLPKSVRCRADMIDLILAHEAAEQAEVNELAKRGIFAWAG